MIQNRLAKLLGASSIAVLGAASFALACSASSGNDTSSGGSGGASGSTAAGAAGASGHTATGGGSSGGSSGAMSGAGAGGSSGSGGGAGGSAGSGGAAPTCITPTAAQTCVPPSGTTLPICKLSLTGCMDSAAPTKFVSKAIPYEVNSPLWSDNAAKSRAFVLPAGGKIHVKNCAANQSAAVLAADCTSPGGTPNGPADTGKWVLPVGTVMIKNFMFDGKVVETRLLMRVDAATSAMLQNTYGFQLGTDWVGYNYAWNKEQTEATIVPNARTEVSFDTGTRKVPWSYPNFLDCTGCHSPAVGTIGPETDQMDRMVAATGGGMVNQIDAFATLGLFDTAPAKPYGTAMVQPYQNAALGLNDAPSGSVDQQARSYLGANCGFCHRPDVNDQGFDLRFSLSLKDTNICNLMEQNGIPPNPQMQYADFAPGNHLASAMWLRMAVQIPDNPGTQDYGRMPSVASNVVDTQATKLVGDWIDSIKTCP